MSAALPWIVNVLGPNDVHEFATEVEALEFANNANTFFAEGDRAHANDPNWPRCMALAKPNPLATSH
jgi:hypothetical protein